jgi:PTS system nitrogen regulatory IIA component
MSQLGNLLSPARVALLPAVSSKKRALELVSELMAAGDSGLNAGEVFACLVERERLGSTGLGHGVALPHARLKGLEHALCAFLKLDAGVDFDAADGEPVRMICALLVPEQSTSEHLDILAMLAGMFSDETLRRRVQDAGSGGAVHDLLSSWRQPGGSRTAGVSA